MLKKRFGIEYPIALKNEPVGQYLLACCSFLVEMLKYAEVGDLKKLENILKKYLHPQKTKKTKTNLISGIDSNIEIFLYLRKSKDITQLQPYNGAEGGGHIYIS